MLKSNTIAVCYDKTIITNLYLKIKQKYVIERPNHNTYKYLCIQNKTNELKNVI